MERVPHQKHMTHFRAGPPPSRYPPAPSDQCLYTENEQQMNPKAKAGAGRNLIWKRDFSTFLLSDLMPKCISSFIPYFKIKSKTLQPHKNLPLGVPLWNKAIQYLLLFFLAWDFRTSATWESAGGHRAAISQQSRLQALVRCKPDRASQRLQSGPALGPGAGKVCAHKMKSLSILKLWSWTHSKQDIYIWQITPTREACFYFLMENGVSITSL